MGIAARDRVMLMFGAANRDPAMFENPDEFRLDRSNVHKQVAFGAGIHRCVGAPFAQASDGGHARRSSATCLPNLRLTRPDDVKVAWTTSREFTALNCSW